MSKRSVLQVVTEPGEEIAQDIAQDIAQEKSETVSLVDDRLADPSPPAKRGRGRPRKDVTAPVDVGDAPAAKRAPKKTVAALAKMFQETHLLLAMKTQNPTWAIDAEEATKLAEAGSDLAEYYKIKVSGKNGAWLGLGWAATLVYGPRAFVLIVEALKKNKEQSQQHSATFTQFQAPG